MTKWEMWRGEGFSTGIDAVSLLEVGSVLAALSPALAAASLARRRSFSSLRRTAVGGERGANGRFQISRGARCMKARPSSLLIRSASCTYPERWFVRHESTTVPGKSETDLVVNPILLHPLCAFGIQVITKHKAPLLRSRNREWTDASHDIGHHLSGLEVLRHQSIVFVRQTRVPVDFRKVKGEFAAGFVLRMAKERCYVRDTFLEGGENE